MADQTIFVNGLNLGATFGTTTLLPGNINISVPGIPSSAQTYFVSVGNITQTQSIGSNVIIGMPTVIPLSDTSLNSIAIKQQVPDFIKENHEKFVAFMEAYYEWLEIKGQAIYESKKLLSNQDIDTSVDQFVEEFRKEFLVNIPPTILADKKNLLKNIKDFYRARGTEKSYRLFFRILFDLPIEFYYPRIDILRVSDGKWIQNKTLRVTQVSGDPFQLVGRKIRGQNNNASAFVENVQQIQEGFITAYEIYLNKSSISGTFDTNEVVKSSDNTIVVKTLSLVTGIIVDTGGLGYQVGQDIIITGTGTGALAKIKSVNDQGTIQSVEIISYGAGYNSATITAPIYPGVTLGATLSPVYGALTNYPGFYLNQDGQLSTTKFLQDGYFYQQFSYVIYVNESVDKYRDALKKQLHPAGLIFFGGFRSQAVIPGQTNLPGGNKIYTLVKILEQQFWNPSLDGQGPPINAKSNVSSIVSLNHIINKDESSVGVGPTYRSIERDKFGYKPNPRYDASQDVADSANSNYWDTYANYQNKDFGNINVGDMINKPWTRTNIMPEPVFRTSTLTGIHSSARIGSPTVI